VKILITGAGGQLGQDLVAACDPGRDDIIAADHRGLDVGDRDEVLGAITSLQPDIVIHAAAWTAVDACESDLDRAWKVNALGSRHVAEACRLAGAHLCAVSTDYVFDGTATTPYTEWDHVNPLSVYGRSKLGGEREIQALLPGASIVRTSWLCGAGGPNFVRTMLRLAGAGAAGAGAAGAAGAGAAGAAGPAGPTEVRVVNDQWGCPTFTADLAQLVRTIAVSRLPGVFHATNQGATTWYELARLTFELAGADVDRVIPITTAELDPPRPAPRPAYSVLDNAALRLQGIPLLADHREPIQHLVKELLQ